MLLRTLCRHFGWIVLCLVVPGALASSISDLSEFEQIALAVGCSLGFIIIVVLVCIVCCVACKGDKTGRGTKTVYSDPSSLKSGDKLEKVPPGVWMTNPQMMAETPAQAYGQYRAKTNQQHKARNYMSEPMLNKPSPGYSEDMLRHLPATVLTHMMSQQASKGGVKDRFYPGSSPDMLIMQRAKPVARVDPSRRQTSPPTRKNKHERRKEDLVKEVTMPEEVMTGSGRKQLLKSLFQTAREITENIVQSERATARVFVNDFAATMPPPTKRESENVAKAYNYHYQHQTTEYQTAAPTDGTGENVARVFSSYPTLDAPTGNRMSVQQRPSSPSSPYVAKAIVRMDSGSNERGIYTEVNDGYNVHAKSDWILYDPHTGERNRTGVGRSASNVEHGQAAQRIQSSRLDTIQAIRDEPDVAADVPLGPYGNGRILRSPSNAQHNLDQRPSSRDSSVLLLDPPVIRNPVQRSFSDATNVPHYQAPNDPNALYAELNKVKRQSSAAAYVRRPEEARTVIQNTPRPSYPAPPLPEETPVYSTGYIPSRVAPPPPVPPPPPPVTATAVAYGGGPQANMRMTIQEEMEQIRRVRKSLPSQSEGEETYARAGSDVTSDAFLFLDNYSIAETASLPRSNCPSLSSQTGPEVITSEAFQFLDRYSIGTITDDEGASPGGSPTRNRRGKGKSLTSDAFRFLDEYI